MQPASSPSTLKFGPYELDLRAGELRKFGIRIRIQEKPLQLLAALAEQSGQAVSREELCRRLWPGDVFVDSETGLNTAASKLRDALSDRGEKPRYIETIPRRGYRFLVPVEAVNGHAAMAPPEPAAAPPELPARKPAVRRLVWIALAAALAIGAGITYWLTEGSPAFAFRSRDSVLIADFENRTGDPRFDNALATAFTVGIEQSRYANVVPRMRLDAVLKRMERSVNEPITAALGREICQREGVRALIACGITRAGREYELTAQLIDPQSGESVRSFQKNCSGEDRILDALDALSREIRGALGESRYQIHLAGKPLPDVTTRSLGALQQYADGAILWRQGKYRDSVAHYQAAIGADPDFAMAHSALGRAYYSYFYNQQKDGESEYRKALALASRTTDRERMAIEANFALDRDHVDEADVQFRAYLGRYPDDGAARFDYANLLRRYHLEPEAIEQYREVLRVMPEFVRAHIGIANANRALNNYPQAIEAYAKAFAADPNVLTTGDVSREYGFTLVANGQDEKAAQIFSGLLTNRETRESGLRSLAFLDLYHGRYASARSHFEQSLEIVRKMNFPLSLARLHLCLAIVAEGLGDRAEQRKNLDAASSYLEDIQAKVVFGAMLGDAYARAGMVEQAGKIAATIAPLVDDNSAEQLGYWHLLQGEIALSGGQFGKAIELLKESEKDNTTGLSTEALAHAYQQSGAGGDAVALYEKMLPSVDRALGWEPQQRWLEGRYTLAMDYSARGDRTKAREMLAGLLHIWAHADDGLPLLRQAKAQYARLQ
jgi:DNA-binding winged helix-turn-helix (wHTH) protein/tetratricopeptide (TPR) repeat protein